MPDAPVVRPVGDSALLVEFGAGIDAPTHARVVALDAALAAAPLAGVIETVPSFASLLVVFDPVVVGPDAVEAHVRDRLAMPAATADATTHVVPVTYDGGDLDAVAERLGVARDAVIAAHLAGDYRVYMYGFAPGYAYMGGVLPALHLPRKPVPERGHPPGTVMIAGGQCLIMTLPMPTGWWILGHTTLRVLDPDGPQPFRFAVGDRVRFECAG